MRVLLTGSEGFLGRAIAAELERAGHVVHRGIHRRNPGGDAARSIPMDFTRDHAPAAWVPRLRGMDAVINAVGIFRESGEQTFDAVHVKAPRALFLACVEAGVPAVIQISALGADAGATSRFHRSKREADELLSQLPLRGAVAQPSLVFGEEGASSRLFLALASLPLVPLPGDGAQRIQPIHVDDAARCIAALLQSQFQGRVALVGPQSLTFREYLAALRAGMGLGKARFLRVPLAMLRATGPFGRRLGLPDAEALAMLERGNVADPGGTHALLGHAPRPVVEFNPAHKKRDIRQLAASAWLAPLLRLSIAVVWIASGLVSLGPYPVERSYELLAQAGVPSAMHPLALYGAAALDLVLGVATLAFRHRAVWLAQAAVIVGYTAILTLRMPEFWLHPFGPLVKNLPMLAVIGWLCMLERR